MCEKNHRYDEHDVYHAVITAQTFLVAYLHETPIMRLALSIKVLGGRQEGGATGARIVKEPPEERVVVLLFPRAPSLLARTLGELEQLGFDDDDITRLHPDHLDCYTLVGRKVRVRVTLLGGREWWRLVWLPGKVLTLDSLSRLAEPLKTRIAALRGSAPTRDSSNRRRSAPPADQHDEVGDEPSPSCDSTTQIRKREQR
jgi:hypothetical protein